VKFVKKNWRKEMSYNGWSNFETWSVFTHLTNEYGTNKYCDSEARYFLTKNGGNKKEATEEMKDRLEGIIWENAKESIKEDLESGSSMYVSAMRQWYNEIDFDELAKAFIEGVYQESY
jgi:hypothetical protein